MPAPRICTASMFANRLTSSRLRLISTHLRKMSTMEAIVVEKQGGLDALLLKKWPRPEVIENTIVVKNHSIGINYIDTYHRSGVYTLATPFIPGREGAGEVVQVGPGVTDFKVGDRVAYLSTASYAEYTRVSLEHVAKIPTHVSYETAAAAVLQGLTAWTMVRDGYPVKAGDYVLVHAAAGGVGLLLCQMCAHLGAHVIGTVSTDAKAELARGNGAKYVINYSHENVALRVSEITGGLGCHAVLDGVGASTWETSLAAVRRLGTVISFGNASGVVPPISLLTLSQKNIKLMRPTLFQYIVTPEEFNKWWGELFGLLEQKKLKVKVHKIYKLEDVRSAHEDLEGRKTTGKLLLKL
ncbi:hypothetical protein BC938DRAFT_482249 [Jimgerdemannia flammicorona]|uniref:Probable quinone oxidoreductase n=1 Tax=Jimgerdemannia flammicorona TaxID=994334 RepID=A0A433QED3_9FUNG|nr:hypothetical protein BC938DRAFT_482249 [Jimgerdemannia flammicorona]